MIKKHRVVMLPTNKPNQGTIWQIGNSNFIAERQIDDRYTRSEHLYILSDEEIKEGDWFIVNNNDIIKQCVPFKESVKDVDYIEANNGLPYLRKHCKKIIASTDKSLEIVSEGVEFGRIRHPIPQINESTVKAFIEDYNNGKIWECVNVEYEEQYIGNFRIEIPIEKIPILKLKLNDDNTIITHPIEDIFTREEMFTNIITALTQCINNPFKFDKMTKTELKKWFDKNF